jgi:hypothetical protein
MNTSIFKKYFKKATKSNATNAKLLLLTRGLDCNFKTIKEKISDPSKEYKVNQIRVSDRHFISTTSEQRKFIPDELILTDENNQKKSLSKIYYAKDSPIQLTTSSEEFVIINKKDKKELPVKIELVKKKEYAKQKYKGFSLDEFIQTVGIDRFSIIPFDGCEHWICGEQCGFCGANKDRLKPMGVKPNVFEMKKFSAPNAWWGYYKENFLAAIDIALKELLAKDKTSPHFHFMIISGNILNIDLAWAIALDISKKVNERISIAETDSYINLMPPKSLSYLEKAKETGFQNISINLEVFDKKNFVKVCPGKNRHWGYDKLITALEQSVKIFGNGRARTNFVLGAEPLNTTLKGAIKLAKKGIVSDYSIFFPRPGAIWNHKKAPAPDEVIQFSKKLAIIYKKHNFKPFCCSLSSRSSIMNECYEGEL